MMYKKAIFSLLLGCYLLSACGGNSGGGVGEVLGLNRRPPDEFLVLSRPPLTLPPNFTLSPTAADNSASQESESIRQVIFGDAAADIAAEEQRLSEITSAGELYLLQTTDAIGASDDIRSQVDLETAQLVEEDENFIRGLLGTEAEFGTAIEAEEEYKRLQNLEQ